SGGQSTRSSAHCLTQEFLDNDYPLYMPDTRLYHVGLALQKMAANYIESIDQARDLRLLISFLSKRLGKPATRRFWTTGRWFIWQKRSPMMNSLINAAYRIGNNLPATVPPLVKCC
ncbi:hypothetical protein, partial [Escherichia coli]